MPAAVRFGATRFRADARVGDARFSPDGRRVVGYAGRTVYVWDVADGSVVRTIDTKLGLFEDPIRHDERDLAFAVHPKESRVAVGGIRDGKTVLQVWDFESGKSLAETISPGRGRSSSWPGRRTAPGCWSGPTSRREKNGKSGRLIVRDAQLEGGPQPRPAGGP